MCVCVRLQCYWFSVEFGLCEQDGERKAYGAGLLSSFGELEYAMGTTPKVLPFDPFVAAEQEYPITTYQPTYFQAQRYGGTLTNSAGHVAIFTRIQLVPGMPCAHVCACVRVCVCVFGSGQL